MVQIWSWEAAWCRDLHSGVNCVITAFNELWLTGRSTFSDELGVFRGGLSLPCEFTGFEMLHLPLQLGCICNAVVSTVKTGSYSYMQAAVLHGLG